MTYAAQVDVEVACGGRHHLVQLTDNDNTGELDSTVLATVLAGVDSWIDSALHKRFAVPVASPVPLEITYNCAAETVYRLMLARNTATDDQHKAKDAREAWLTMVAEGRRDLGLQPAPTSSSLSQSRYIERSCAEPISREALKGSFT
jgi:phage gp36-like protein